MSFIRSHASSSLTKLFIVITQFGSAAVLIPLTLVETIHYERPYKFSIVQTKGSSTYIDEKPSYSGTFDLVVQDSKGAETSRKSINQYFGNMELTIDGPLKLTVNDYNGDDLLDIPIGFSAGDGSGEYIISVG